MQRMKLYYLSTASFSQVDVGVLDLLAGKCDIHYSVVIQNKNTNFTSEELQDYCARNGVAYQAFLLKYRFRDIRIASIFYSIIQDIREKNPDVIYIASFDHPIFALLSGLLDRKKVIIGLHDVEYHSNFPNAKMLGIGRKIVMSLFQTFQVFSKSQERLFRRLYPSEKVYAIPLPLSDYGDGQGAAARDGGVRFLFFGNILPYKGLDVLLNAVNGLSKTRRDFTLTIAGRCDDWSAQYEPMIGDDSVIEKKIGFIGNDEVAPLFSGTDYLVLPYRDATQSGPLMISYNYGVPVIASRIDSFVDQVEEGISGYLFEPESPGDLQKTLERVLTDHGDRYVKLSETTRKFVSDTYSREQIASRYLSMFNEISKRKS